MLQKAETAGKTSARLLQNTAFSLEARRRQARLQKQNNFNINLQTEKGLRQNTEKSFEETGDAKHGDGSTPDYFPDHARRTANAEELLEDIRV